MSSSRTSLSRPVSTASPASSQPSARRYSCVSSVAVIGASPPRCRVIVPSVASGRRRLENLQGSLQRLGRHPGVEVEVRAEEPVAQEELLLNPEQVDPLLVQIRVQAAV